MNFKQYRAVLEAFNDRGAAEWDGILQEQDRLITALVEQGAHIVGWKIVEKERTFAVPIFDFQLFTSSGVTISAQAIRGTEVEMCFQLDVPNELEGLDALVESLDVHPAIELIRPIINERNHPACDFYYDYGVFLSNTPIQGHVEFEGGNKNYTFSYDVADYLDVKKAVLKKGIEDCIGRGYGGKRYFFITGTLNGLVPAKDSIGNNCLFHEGNKLIHFEVN